MAPVSAMTCLMKLCPTRVRTGVPPISRMISGTAREQMRLWTTVSPGCLARIPLATIEVVSEPDSGSPRSSTRKTRSASPSKAGPTSAAWDGGSAGPAQLDAVVLGRVVAGREHGAGSVEATGGEVDQVGGGQPGVDHRGAGQGGALHEGGRQRARRRAHVPGHDDAGGAGEGGEGVADAPGDVL